MFKIVYIGASWCGSCKVIKPAAQELAKKFGVEWEEQDYDEMEEDAKGEITKVPTIQIYEDSKKVQEYNMKQVESLEQWLSKSVSLATDDF